MHADAERRGRGTTVYWCGGLPRQGPDHGAGAAERSRPRTSGSQPITGGTGEFKGAGGQMIVIDPPGPREHWRFDFHRLTDSRRGSPLTKIVRGLPHAFGTYQSPLHLLYKAGLWRKCARRPRLAAAAGYAPPTQPCCYSSVCCRFQVWLTIRTDPRGEVRTVPLSVGKCRSLSRERSRREPRNREIRT